MKQMRKIGVYIMCICILISLAACADPAKEKDVPAMGRYVEEVLPLPKEINSIQYFELSPNGSFLILGNTADHQIKFWESTDGGESWNVKTEEWTKKMKQYNPSAFTVDEDGNPWFTDELEDPVLEELYQSGTDEEIAAYTPPCNLLYSIVDGDVKQHNYRLQNSTGNNAQSMLLQNGHLAVSYGEVVVYDEKSEKKQMEAVSDSFLEAGDYLISQDTLAVKTKAGIQFYNMKDGQKSGELAFTLGKENDNTEISNTAEEGVYAYCNSTGIYRLSSDGLIQERVISGELTSLTMPEFVIERLFVKNDSYYVYATDPNSWRGKLSGATLLRYQYEESVPSVPTTELRIYALQDSPTIRQAVGIFRRKTPQALVQFEIGTEGGITEEDALRVLSTELLAGEGPDILVLDGMPAQSYQEKGVLLDLSQVISPDLKAQILPNLLESYKKEDALYAVPVRFTIPMVLTDQATLDKIDNLHDLTEYVTHLKSPQIGILPGELFHLLYPIWGSEWFLEDGSLNRAAASKGLEDISRLIHIYDGKDADALWNAEGDGEAGAVGWVAGWTPFYLNNLASVSQISGPFTALKEKKGVYLPYPSPSKAKGQLKTVMGISSLSKEKELAADFIECILSLPIQSLVLNDGIPVNKEAIRTAMNPYEDTETSYGGRGMSFQDEFDGGVEKGLTISMFQSDQVFQYNMMEMLQSITIFQTVDDRERLVRKETEAYFNGTKNLEKTVESLQNKWDLYLEESKE